MGFQCWNVASTKSREHFPLARVTKLIPAQQSSVRQRGSVSSRFGGLQREQTQTTTSSRFRSNSSLSGESDEEGIEHQVVPRAATAMLPPVMV